MAQVLAVILGGGRGTRLFPLTKYRSKPAVPIAGRYRLIDIPISNCINSGIEQIFVLTQFQSFSLHKHVYGSFKFDSFRRGFVEILPAEQRMDTGGWFQGTADAVRQNIDRFVQVHADAILVLSGDQLYRMDFRRLLQTHMLSQADVTIAATPVSKTATRRLGIMRADREGRVTRFVEKPKAERELAEVRTPDSFFRSRMRTENRYLASMGIYMFRPDVLHEILTESAEPDFGRDIIPAAIHTRRVYAHYFEGYWEDIGTIGAFHAANINMASSHPKFNFHDETNPIFTHARYLPGAQVADARLRESILSEGCRVREAQIEQSVIGVRIHIGAGSQIRRTIVMGADFYESPAQRAENRRRRLPDIGIGKHARIENAIIDKNARIGHDVEITNNAGVEEADHDCYSIRERIVVVHKGAVIPDGTRI